MCDLGVIFDSTLSFKLRAYDAIKKAVAKLGLSNALVMTPTVLMLLNYCTILF